MRELNKSLQRHGFKSGEIHGDIDQASRIAELEKFRDGKVNILVASDVAARGLDIKGVSHVFNFDAPWHPDDYVHRIGRTGRAGATGTAYTFVTAEDAEAIDNIQKLIGTKIDYVSAPAREERAEPARSEGGREEKREEGRGRSDRKRDDKPREGRQREDKPRDCRQRDDRPRSDRPRDDRPRDSQPRDSRPDRTASAPPPRRRHDPVDDGPDDGWNGPVPEFLNFGFTD